MVPQKKKKKLQSKMIHIRLTEDNHRRLKMEVAKQGLTIQEWASKLIENNLVHKPLTKSNRFVDK